MSTTALAKKAEIISEIQNLPKDISTLGDREFVECIGNRISTFSKLLQPLATRGVEATKVGLTIRPDLSLSDWKALGQQLKLVQGAIQWWIGDWLNFGERTYGDKYTEALTVTDYDEKSLRNIKYVAGAVEMSLRRDNLSWSHHKEVAALPREEQKQLLDWAESSEASTKTLRDHIKNRSTERSSEDCFKELLRLLGPLLPVGADGQPKLAELLERAMEADFEEQDLKAVTNMLGIISEHFAGSAERLAARIPVAEIVQ